MAFDDMTASDWLMRGRRHSAERNSEPNAIGLAK